MKDFVVELSEIVKGLRQKERSPNNIPTLTEISGIYPREGLLASLPEPVQIALTDLPEQTFPFPQLFKLTNLTLVCGENSIWEFNETNNSFAEVLANIPGNHTWSVIDFVEWIYLTNGKVAVVRNAGSKQYEVVTELPFGSCLCNYNGQILIGAPNVS